VSLIPDGCPCFHASNQKYDLIHLDELNISPLFFLELPQLASFAAQHSQGLAGHTFSVVLSYPSIKRFFNGFIRERGVKQKNNRGYQFKATKRVLLMRGESKSGRKGNGALLGFLCKMPARYTANR
jgi:hypothetical protein